MSNLNFFGFAYVDHSIANKICEYNDNRTKLIELLRRCFTYASVKIPAEKEYLFQREVDPFTILSLLQISTLPKNKELLRYFIRVLKLDLEIPSSTAGISKPRYFAAIDDVESVDKLWELFISAIDYADTPTEENKSAFRVAYENSMSIQSYCTRFTDFWNITVGLSSIRPYSYAKICKQSRAFIEEARVQEVIDSYPRIINDAVLSFDDYLSICETLKNVAEEKEYGFSSLPEFSFQASSDYTALNKERIERAGKQKNEFIHWVALIFNAVTDIVKVKASASLDDIRTKIEHDEGLDIGEIKKNKEYSSLFSKYYIAVRDLGLMENNKAGAPYTITELGSKTVLTDQVLDEFYLKSSYEVEPLSFTKKPHYWLYTPGEDATKWSEFSQNGSMGMDFEIGNIYNYGKIDDLFEALKSEYGENAELTQSIWEFANLLQVGDIVYVKKGSSLLGRGVVESNYIYDDTRIDFNHIHKVKWTHTQQVNAPYKKLWDSMFMRLSPTTDIVGKFEGLFL